MKAMDIMSAPVTTVGPDTAVAEVAAILVERRISGVPVVEHDKLIGIVSEGDLLHRHEVGTDRSFARRSWWARLVDADPLPAEYVKSHGRRAKDVMTRHVVSVPEAMPLAQVALIFDDRGIKRVRVLRCDGLVGIVCRSDLMRALLLSTKSATDSGMRSDEAIRGQLLDELAQQRWWRADWSTVFVEMGVVHYRGMLQDESERRAARVAAENVPGVRGVLDDRMLVPNWTPMM